ncbi:hypothetical protein [Leptospira yasudae]|uniref:Lipoprotein n=1 Tax=Leptospira yasudae TaxID=2202201 RepID=A0A6N4QUE9_9LEPT|nr:hypothetical protein [Leptospira yasudae]TGL78152.1 hypothetical protein EHQ72_10335 [Leptospira yasudae]TGL80694.1 hypothetical protein EHQ77_08245 [Leptospira yasudae]TGL85235.1 hypothetical protein EHQ83_08675 [Leptospira yasudae]
MSRIILLSLCFLFLQGCSVFLTGNSLPITPKDSSQIETEVTYELIGWQDDASKKLASEILRTLHLSNRFKRISLHTKTDSEIKIQIILESSPRLGLLFGEQPQPVSWMVEKKPWPFSLYLLNRILAIQTFFIVPILQKSEDKITFRVWKWNQKIGEYPYSIDSVHSFGWISLGLTFIDDSEEIESAYSLYTKKFLSDSRSIY